MCLAEKSKILTEIREAASIESEAIGTLPLLRSNMGDVVYLKLLLIHNHCKGKFSESDLRTVDGTTHNICKETYIALGLLGDYSEWNKYLDEVEVASTPTSF